MFVKRKAGQIVWAGSKSNDEAQEEIENDNPELLAFLKPVNRAVLTQIMELEAEITMERLRQAILGIDNGWLADKHAEIEQLKSGL